MDAMDRVYLRGSSYLNLKYGSQPSRRGRQNLKQAAPSLQALRPPSLADVTPWDMTTHRAEMQKWK